MGGDPFNHLTTTLGKRKTSAVSNVLLTRTCFLQEWAGAVWVLECRRRMHSTMQHADKHISHCLDRSWEWLECLSACQPACCCPWTFFLGGATASFNTQCSNDTGVKGGAPNDMVRERMRATRCTVCQQKHFTAGVWSQVKCQHLSQGRRHLFRRQWVRKPGAGPRCSERRLTSLFSPPRASPLNMGVHVHTGKKKSSTWFFFWQLKTSGCQTGEVSWKMYKIYELTVCCSANTFLSTWQGTTFSTWLAYFVLTALLLLLFAQCFTLLLLLYVFDKYL